MVLKINQLKKLNMKELKAIIKKNKLGKISKKKKAQLIGIIANCESCKMILSGLSLPVRKRKPPSAKQLEARKRFGDKMRNKKRDTKDIKKKDLVKRPIIKKKDPPKPVVLVKRIVEEKKEAVVEVIKDIKKDLEVPAKVIEKVADVIEELMSKKSFLDMIFGVSIFNFQDMMTDLLNELEDEDKLMKLMSKPKKELKQFFQKAFDNDDSIMEMISAI